MSTNIYISLFVIIFLILVIIYLLVKFSNMKENFTLKNSLKNSLKDISPFVGDGVTDNSPALNSLLNNLSNTSGGVIRFGSGIFLFNSEINFTFPINNRPFTLTFTGDGQRLSTLYFTRSNGITLNLSYTMHSFHFNGLTFACGCQQGYNNWCNSASNCDTTNRGNYVALTLTNSYPEGNFEQNDIQNCTFQGIEGGQSCNYWNASIWIRGVSNINYYNLLIYGAVGGWVNNPENQYYGNGIIIDGPTNKPDPNTGLCAYGAKPDPNTGLCPYTYSIVHNFQMCSIYNLGNCLIIGDFVQGVTLNQCNIANGGIGIYSPPDTVGVLSELAITNSYFYCFEDQIRIKNNIDQIMITNNNFFVTKNNTGINLANCNLFNIGLNQFTCSDGNNNSGTTGINLENCSKGIISGNVYYCLETGINMNNSDTNSILSYGNLQI